MSSTSFTLLNVPEAQLSNLESLGYHQMTPIQAAALPGALNGEDMIAQAKTGSGKTAVFALAILSKLDIKTSKTQALILCPTRELSIQVTTEVRRLARYQQNVKVTTLYGGQPIYPQKQSLKHGTHIVVGTPGRIKDHLEQKTLNLNHVETLVLDEADRMLDMGFIKDMETIIKATPSSRQTLLFSATFPENIESLSSRFQKNPTRISVDSQHNPSDIQQHIYMCKKDTKLASLKTLLLHYQPRSAVVFCNFKQTTRDISDYLIDHDFSTLALHGDLEQRDREEIFIRFKHQSCSILVATDIAARGLDIKDLPTVINYELPHDSEVYVHRIGRTGRAGSTGTALTLCTDNEKRKIDAINTYQGTELKHEPIASLRPTHRHIPEATHVTFCIFGGRKDKLRPGEILGTLTSENGVDGKDVGKIDVMDRSSYVAIKREAVAQARHKLQNSKIKGRSYKIKTL